MLRGTFTALITPFTERGDFDRSAFRKIIEEQIAAGIDGVVAIGTTGESPTVTHDENIQIVEYAVDIVHGRTKVIAGTGSNSTKEAIDMTKKAARVGADAAMIVCPYYNKPTQEGLYLHFKTIAEEVPEIPQILYNVPGRTGVNLLPETTLRLSQIPNIIALKDATGSREHLHILEGKLPEYFSILCGEETLTVDFIKAGAHGVISVASNLYPQIVKAMVDAALSNDFNTAEKINAEEMDFYKACFCESNPIPIKTMMSMAGKCEEVFRLPLCNISPENRKRVQNFV